MEKIFASSIITQDLLDIQFNLAIQYNKNKRKYKYFHTHKHVQSKSHGEKN